MPREEKPPGYLTEDLELRIVSGPPRYAVETAKPVEHVTLRRASGELIGYLYFNDEDDVAGWQARAGATPEAWNEAGFWIVKLQQCKQRGLKPGEALNELLQITNASSEIVRDSRRTVPNLAALRELAATADVRPFGDER
jgi:hypothetical protein